MMVMFTSRCPSILHPNSQILLLVDWSHYSVDMAKVFKENQENREKKDKEIKEQIGTNFRF